MPRCAHCCRAGGDGGARQWLNTTARCEWLCCCRCGLARCANGQVSVPDCEAHDQRMWRQRPKSQKAWCQSVELQAEATSKPCSERRCRPQRTGSQRTTHPCGGAHTAYQLVLCGLHMLTALRPLMRGTSSACLLACSGAFCEMSVRFRKQVGTPASTPGNPGSHDMPAVLRCTAPHKLTMLSPLKRGGSRRTPLSMSASRLISASGAPMLPL